MPHLFDSYTLKDVRLRNRIAVAPMSQYSAVDGVVNDWHLVNLGARAAGGAGLAIAEASAVVPEGRITSGCAGLWRDDHIEPWKRVADFVRAQGTVPGIQLAHAGRKASAQPPWKGGTHLDADDSSAWEPVGPSARAYGGKLPRGPRELSRDELAALPGRFAEAAERARHAGFDWLELHFAHGYLVNSFLSPLANHRDDDYGGSFDNRCRLALEIFDAVRAVWSENLPLTVRLGVCDFDEAGQTLEEGIELARRLKDAGMDLLDVSLSLNQEDSSGVPWGPGFMLPVAERIRREVDIPVAVGWMIDDPKMADEAIHRGQTDLFIPARPILADPHWPYHAAQALGREAPETLLPDQYAAWLKASQAAGRPSARAESATG